MQSLQFEVTTTRRQATEYRLARLDRKLARVEPTSLALF
jgi:hypothetical protein